MESMKGLVLVMSVELVHLNGGLRLPPLVGCVVLGNVGTDIVVVVVVVCVCVTLTQFDSVDLKSGN